MARNKQETVLQALRPGQSVELLKALHILTRDGRINQDSRRKLKTVVFKSGTESMLALLGGHIDLSANAPEQTLKYIESGKLRALAIGAPRRLPGPLAAIPTWKEAGLDVVTDTWRGIVAPKSLTTAQIAYWDGVFGKLVQSRAWREEIEKHYWLDTYLDSAGSRQFLASDYLTLKAALTDLGLVK